MLSLSSVANAGAFTDLKLACKKDEKTMGFSKIKETTINMILNEREMRFFLEPIPNAWSNSQKKNYFTGLFMGTQEDGVYNYDGNRLRSYAGLNIDYIYATVEPKIFETRSGKIVFMAVHTMSSSGNTQVDVLNLDCRAE